MNSKQLLLLGVTTLYIMGLLAQNSPLNIEVNFGLARNTMITETMPEHDYLNYPKTVATLGLGGSYLLSPHYDIYTFPHLRTRYFEQNSPYMTLSSKSLYLDVPILLRTQIFSAELGAGANLAFALKHGHGGNVTGLNSEGASENPNIIPGYCIAAIYRNKGNPRRSLQLYYRWDLVPYSSAWGIDKTQESGGVAFCYALFNGSSKTSLLEYTQAGDANNLDLQIGVQEVKVNDFRNVAPYFRLEVINYNVQNWGFGTIQSLMLDQFVDGKVSLTIFRPSFQAQLSYQISRFEPYLAGGFSPELCISLDRSTANGPMDDENFPVWILPNPMLIMEAGCRVQVWNRIHLEVHVEHNLNMWYKSGYTLGLGVTLRAQK